MNTKRMSIIILAVWGIFWAWSQQASALKPPHNASRTIGCVSCHYPRAKFRTLTGFDSLCFNQAYGCHNVFASGTSAASKKRLSTLNASNRFKKLPRDSNYATYSTNKKQSSHGWKIPNTNNDAGVTVDWQPNPGLSNLRDVGPAINKRIYCSRCHQAHGETGAIRSFLRVTPRGDIICLQCHAARRVSNVRDPLPSTSLHYSHPVEVNYSSVKADPAKKDLFESAPLNPYTNNPTAELKLYTAFNYDVNTKITGVKAQKAVLCSTCHGPIHSSDSNPYTFDNLTTYSKGGFTSYSSSSGNLLRRYPMSKSNDICISCHKVQIHQGNNCGVCHEPHKKAGDNNIYLIRTSIMTPNSGKRSVQFRSTTEMADRWRSQGAADGISNAICQVCHTTTPSHRNYSTAGVPRETTKMNEHLGGGKYRNCAACHSHANGFPKSGGGCNGCHGAPDGSTSYPSDAVDGKHQKHIGTPSASYSWGSGTLADSRSAGAYGFSCGRCHSPFARYTDSQHYVGTAAGNYTTDIGFKNKSILPNNTGASYLFGATGGIDPGRSTGATWRYPSTGANDGQCRNLYCHGQFYNGYTGFNPTWEGTAQCGKCHGVAQELGRGLPGNMNNSNNYGAHPRHVGGAAVQGYGQGSANFRCNACHSTSATQNAISSIGLDRSMHVNGRINVNFAAAYGSGNATYNNMNNYTARLSIAVTKPAYKTCGLIYCHSDGSRIQGNYSTSLGALAVKFPNWSSSKNFTSFAGTTTKRRCARCHGAERVAGVAGTSFNGITAAMPGYASRAGKGNSHRKHVIDNGFMCNVCHDATVNADNRSIKDTTKHVNQYYDVVIISRYGGTYDNTAKRCSSVKCHGGRQTAVWGDPGRCQDCHFKNTPETKQDEGYYDGYTFKKFTSTVSVPRLYSTEWTQRGHGSSNASKLPKGCTDCHKQTQDNVSHETALSGNIYRVYTAAQHLDDLCLECHSDTRSKPTQADIKVQGHTAAVIGAESNATWAFTPKCIDCHDPHGDKNRGMLHTYINYSGSDTAGKRTYDNQQASGLMNFSTVGDGQINWSSFVKSNYTGICQRCHNTQVNLNHFYKESPGYDVGHNPANKCTNCHKHTEGFKPLPCDGCHKFPPTLSGKHALHVATSVSKSYVDYANESKTRFYAYGCGKCHDRTSSQHYSGQGLFTTEVVFNQSPSQKLPKNPNGSYAFGARSSIDDGAKPTPSQDSYQWVSTKGTCKNLYCHGQFFGGYSSNDPTWYGSQPCGKCHGVPSSKGNGLAPSGGAHSKHVTTYSMPCKGCHRDVTGSFNAYTVSDRSLHVNGISNIRLYTSTGDATVGSRIGRSARYGASSNEFASVTTNTNPASAPAYRYCQNVYCHSRGTSTQSPYTSRVSYPNYTAKWSEGGLTGDKKCAYCHGNKTWKGLTAAMPYQGGQAHKIHVIDNNFSCSACHSKTVKGYGTLSSVNMHVNKVRDVYIQKYYSGSYNGGSKTCANVKCHGMKTTPAWSTTGINCKDCHLSNSSDNMSYTFRSFTEAPPTIYSSEWAESGHGKTTGNYRVTNRAGANKNCSTCHVSSVKHNTGSNFFRLTGLGGGTDPSALCKRCHGTSTERQSGWFGTVTGVQGHTQQILSSAGYANLTTWRFKPKCTDCHDPHGEGRATSGNIAMIRNSVLFNASGSDSSGRPIKFPSLTTVNFTKYNGTTSFDDNQSKGRVCAVCHKRTAHNGQGTGHSNAGLDCRTCHKHKQGFNPSGCTGCHGDDTKLYDRSKNSPPKGPSGWSDSMTNRSSLHLPHAYNPNGRPGFVNMTGFACTVCHGPQSDGRSEAAHPGGTNEAGMGNMTTGTSSSKMSRINFGTQTKNPADDTCSSTRCHTPRAYTRAWKKPTKCDDCHGFRNTPAKDGAAAGTYNLITSGSHKMHAYSSASFRYAFTCRNCHKYVGNNFTTHYSGFVNITFGQALGQSASTGNYGRGLTGFKGATTGGEWTTSTCSQVYCHGYFGTYSGGKSAQPKWGDKATAACGSCHGNTAGTLAKRHPAHINNYGFSCRRCHSATAGVNNTIIDQRTHVNNTENVQFNITGAMDNTNGTTWGANDARKCKNIYCHSSGARTTGNTWATRTTISNYTADWSKLAAGMTGAGKGCSLCHGSKNFGNNFAGITAAMPNYPGQAHAKHAHNTAGDNFKCYACHASTVNAAGSIISYSNHVNGFKNISIISTYKAGATNYGAAKTCENVKCHGSRKTPAWNTTANCQACHYTTAAETVNYEFRNYSVTASIATIYSTEWSRKGHGSSTVNRTCTKCHNSGIAHNNTNNPFRLYTSDPDALCANCHGSGSAQLGRWGSSPTYGNTTTYKTHSKANTGPGDGQWNQFPPSGNGAAKCVDCHDPHGDKNKKMVQAYINISGSDRFGRPSAPPTWNTVNTATAVQMTFSTPIGTNWSSFANNAKTGICQRCHTPGDVGLSVNMTKTGYVGNHQSHQPCTNCHKHRGTSGGFGAAGGEPDAGTACTGCHATLVTDMQSASAGWHHVMNNDAGTYGNMTMFGNADMNDASRRCTMCHVEHAVFSPDKNTTNGKRGKNLRVNARVSGDPANTNTFINTDFWPAKRSAPRADGTANYNASNPVMGPTGYFGVCISCHKNVQYKNTTLQKDADNTSRAKEFAVNLYTSSSHNFQILSSLVKFSNGGSNFRANCTKCHNTDYINKPSAQNGRYQMGLHNQNTPALLNNGTSTYKPKIEDMCYKCHDTASRSAGGPGGIYDSYSTIKMSSGSKMIKTAVVAKKSGHPVESLVMAGRHKADEFYNVTGTVAANSNPPATKFWNFSTTRHVECTDCHNTHGGNASIRRYVGGPYRGDPRDGLGYRNISGGNRVAGSQAGTWGVELDYVGVNAGGTPKYKKVSQIKYQADLCLKCHSNFSYGANPRGVPSGLPDPANPSATTLDNLDPAVPQANIARMINPNNYGYHPIYKKGRNQPAKSLNTNWPAAKSNWMYKDRFTNKTGFIAVSGLSWTFVPPFSQHSLLACSDCHQADNTGKAIQPLAPTPATTPTTGGTGTWTGATVANIGVPQDGNYAQVTAAQSATMQTDVTIGGTAPGPAPEELWVVAYGSTNLTGKTTKTQSLSAWSGGIPGTIIGAAVSVPFGTVIARAEAKITWTATDWNTIETGYSAKITTNGTSSTVKVDYLGLEVVYTTTSDVRGPHGSLEKWILADVDTEIQYDNCDASSVVGNTDNTIGQACDKPNAGLTGYDLKAFCYNCHRIDVYGKIGSGDGAAVLDKYSRIEHPADSNAAVSPATADQGNVWGIMCMNCHAGNGVGEIHGSFASRTSQFPGTATKVIMSRPRGVRLLNGALFTFDPTPGAEKCYTIGASAASPYSSGCSAAQHVDGSSLTAGFTHYSYTSW